MKFKWIFLILLFGIYSIQAQEQEKLAWKENSLLSWEDFKAAPKSTSPFSANTNSGMSYSWNYSTATGKPILEHKVVSNFYPGLSWVKQLEHPDYLLAHEQVHFDITELHARKLRKRLDTYQISRSVKQDLKRIYNQVEAERVAMQHQFDKETSHSERKIEEQRWRNFVAQELEKLSDYSG